MYGGFMVANPTLRGERVWSQTARTSMTAKSWRAVYHPLAGLMRSPV
ncbi:hypothetical protein HMPREF3150_00279 [Pseudomonas aeruginosa]|nr:hypothetical protein HMPREF3150_00279 [Pseudomonas aeruginosa]